MEYVEPMSEKSIGAGLGKQLTDEEILVKYVTTDGDSRLAEGMQEPMRKLKPLWTVEYHADHSQVKLLEAEFSPGMFPGTIRGEQNQQRKLFCFDVKARSHATVDRMLKKYDGDIEQIIKKCLGRLLQLSDAMAVTVLCVDTQV